MTKKQYEDIAAFRRSIRQFLMFSELAAKAAGLTPQQHQLMLAVKGHPGKAAVTVGELSEWLGAKQTAVTNLLGRMEQAGLLTRQAGDRDRRTVAIQLTPHGEELLQKLSRQHLSELQRLRSIALATLPDGGPASDNGG